MSLVHTGHSQYLWSITNSFQRILLYLVDTSFISVKDGCSPTGVIQFCYVLSISHYRLVVSPLGSGSKHVSHHSCEANSKYSCCWVSSWFNHHVTLISISSGLGWNSWKEIGIRINACSWYFLSLEGKGKWPFDESSQGSQTSFLIYKQRYFSSLYLVKGSIPFLTGISYSYSSLYIS